MEANLVYLACVLGAAALFLTLRPGRRGLRIAGGILGLGVFAWLLLATPLLLAAFAGNGSGEGPAAELTEATDRPGFFFLVFSLIAVASALRMITHDRPVYSALYFVLVVISSAGLFLLLQAEFMAFALVIVYAGAILITYLFVIMLAQQAPSAAQEGGEADYDVTPREPAAACVVGFVMLAVLTNMAYSGVPELSTLASPATAQARQWRDLDHMPRELAAVVERLSPGAQIVSGARVQVADGVAYIAVRRAGDPQDSRLAIPPEHLPSNVHRVGLDLVAKFPVSLELAGVILLMAMFGAVVLTRKQIELGEDEIREAAGMRKLALHEEGGGAGSGGGAREGGAR